MSSHEAHERAEHAEEAAHHNKGIALLIAVLALFLVLITAEWVLRKRKQMV